MKNLKLKSLMLTLLTMVAVSMMCVSLTACGDDDDDNGGGSDWPKTFSQKIVANDKTYPITKVGISEKSFGDVDYYMIYLVSDDTKPPFEISVPKASMNKLLDLTKDQRVNPSSPVTVSVTTAYAYGDGSFESGSTLRASISGNTLKLVTKGKILKIGNLMTGDSTIPNEGKSVSHTFSVEYEGTFSMVEPLET